MGGAVGQVGDRQQVERLVDALAGLGVREPLVEGAEADVSGHVGAEQLVVGVLQHELHGAAVGAQRGAGVVEGDALAQDGARRGPMRPRQAPQQRRLARAVGPEQRQATAVGKAEVRAGEDR